MQILLLASLLPYGLRGGLMQFHLKIAMRTLFKTTSETTGENNNIFAYYFSHLLLFWEGFF